MSADTVIPATSAPDGFSNRVRSAVAWRWGSQVIGQIITWTTTLMVVRMLDPQDYGLFAMSQAVLVALNFLNGDSFAASLIQTKDVTERRIGQVFGLLICSNVLLAVTQFLLAPVVAAHYGQPVIADMLHVQALIFLCTPFIALPNALLARKLEFRGLAMVNLLCAIVGALTSLALAWSGQGVWALVLAPIAMFASRAVALTAKLKLLVKPVFDFRGARDIMTFGGAMTLCQMFWIVQSQSDIFIAGSRFTAHELGLYSESLFLTLVFTGRFLPPLNEVAFPAYSELHQAGQSVAPAFLKSARLTMLIAAPLYVGLSLSDGPLVAVVFGPKWIEMVPIMAGLALAMPAMAMQIMCSPATNAMGRPKIYLQTAVAGAILMPLGYIVGVHFGPMGLVHAWWVTAPSLLAITLALTLPAIGAKFTDLLLALMPVAVATGVMAVVVTLVEKLVLHWTPLPHLVLLVVTGIVTYSLTLWLGWREIVLETWGTIRKK